MFGVLEEGVREFVWVLGRFSGSSGFRIEYCIIVIASPRDIARDINTVSFSDFVEIISDEERVLSI